MNNLKILPCLASIIVLILSSCARDEAIDVELPDQVKENIRSCHNDSSRTEEMVFDQLLGSWTYYYVRCAAESTDYQYTGGDLSVAFLADSTLELSEEELVVQIADWTLEEVTENYYRLETDPNIIEIQGEVAFCTDWVGFLQSHIDGCDKLFRKND